MLSYGANDSVTMGGWYSTAGNTYNQVEQIQFADGTVWLAADLTAQGLVMHTAAEGGTVYGLSGYNNTLLGAGGNDILTGGNLADVIDGGAGNDILTGGYGADTLNGGAGDDTLGAQYSYDNFGVYAAQSNLALAIGKDYTGGTGKDLLWGTYGADTYHFDIGDGRDALYETTVDATLTDRLVFGAGITPDSVKVTRSGTSLVLSYGTNDLVTMAGWYSTAGNTYNQVEQVAFADGTTWRAPDLTALGLVVRTAAEGGTAYGLSGYNNTLLGAGGNDILTGGNLADVLDGGAGNDILTGGYGADTLNGGAGDDVLGAQYSTDNYGVYAAQSNLALAIGKDYTGGTGNDTLWGTYGADTYHFNIGDGRDTLFETAVDATLADRVFFGAGITPDSVKVTRNGTSLVLSYGTNDSVTMAGWYTTAGNTYNQVEQVVFADGTAWLAPDLTAQGLVVRTAAEGGTAYGLSGYNNTLLGAGGNDILTGGNLADVIDGGAGNDILTGGYGADTLNGGAGTDTLGAQYSYDNFGVYAAQSNLALAIGKDYTGGTGNDLLWGTYGADTYHFNIGDGRDTLFETSVDGTLADRLVFGAGITPDSVKVTRNGANLVLSYGANDSVTMAGWYTTAGNTYNQVEQVQFADGTVVSANSLTNLALTMQGTNAGESFSGISNYANIFIGNGGNDVINGGTGDDTFIFGWGDAADVINEYGGLDILKFKDGVSPSDISLKQSGADLIVSLGAGVDNVKIAGWYAGASKQIEAFRFADGSTYSPNAFPLIPG